MTKPMRWQKTLSEAELRSVQVVDGPAGAIALFKTDAGELFAVENRCPHFGAPLAAGRCNGKTVTCAFHGWVIDLASGAVKAPNQGQARTYPVRVRDGVVEVGLDD